MGCSKTCAAMAVVPLTIDETLGWIRKDGHVISEIGFDEEKDEKDSGFFERHMEVVILLCFFLVQKFRNPFLGVVRGLLRLLLDSPIELFKVPASGDFWAECYPYMHQQLSLACRETEVLIALKCPISQLEWEIRDAILKTPSHVSEISKIRSMVHRQVSNEKNPGGLGYIGDYSTQLYRDYNCHCKDPYYPTSIMESNKFFFVAHLLDILTYVLHRLRWPGETQMDRGRCWSPAGAMKLM